MCTRICSRLSPGLRALSKIRRSTLFSLMLTLAAGLLSPAAIHAQAPPAPTGLTATAGSGQVALSWNAASGASYYNLYRGTTPGGEGTTPYQAPSPTPGGNSVIIGNNAFRVQGTQGQANGCTLSPLSTTLSLMPLFNGTIPYGTTFSLSGRTDLVTTQTPSFPRFYVTRNTTSGLGYVVVTCSYTDANGNVYVLPFVVHLTGLIATNYTDADVTNGTTYYYQVSAVGPDGTEGPRSAEVSVMPLSPSSPTDLAVYATGNGKVTLYWSGVTGATGYNIYRGTASGGEDYTHPVNGTTPVTTQDTGPGVTNMFRYSDTGLTNGTEYFYTVKAVNGSSQSGPSNEDSDVPDTAAVPWDSGNPSAILSAFRNAFASDVANVGTGSYALRVVGPDNVIYDDTHSTAQPADGTVTPGTNQFVRPDGTSLSLPDDLGQCDTPSSSSSSSGTTPNSVGMVLPVGRGPYRRVRTSASYRGESGMVGLPTALITATGKAHGDTALIFFGVSGTQTEVDSGLQYSTTYGAWEMFMNISGRYVGPEKGQIPPVHLLNIPANFIRIPPGDVPDVSYWAWSGLANSGNTPKTRIKISLLLVDDSFYGSDVAALGAPSKYLKKVENVRAKRVHAIAQNTSGVFPTGSDMDGTTWSQGYVVLTDSAGTLQGWSNANGTKPFEDGSYDGGHANVSVIETSPYIAEDNINVDINSQ